MYKPFLVILRMVYYWVYHMTQNHWFPHLERPIAWIILAPQNMTELRWTILWACKWAIPRRSPSIVKAECDSGNAVFWIMLVKVQSHLPGTYMFQMCVWKHTDHDLKSPNSPMMTICNALSFWGKKQKKLEKVKSSCLSTSMTEIVSALSANEWSPKSFESRLLGRRFLATSCRAGSSFLTENWPWKPTMYGLSGNVARILISLSRAVSCGFLSRQKNFAAKPPVPRRLLALCASSVAKVLAATAWTQELAPAPNRGPRLKNTLSFAITSAVSSLALLTTPTSSFTATRWAAKHPLGIARSIKA